MRITHSYLRKWAQKELNKVLKGAIVVGSYSTRYRAEDYHNGACKVIVNVMYQRGVTTWPILCFLSLKELQAEINNGRKLVLKLNHRLNDYEIWTK